jgi:CHAD domain-containing protein
MSSFSGGDELQKLLGIVEPVFELGPERLGRQLGGDADFPGGGVGSNEFDFVNLDGGVLIIGKAALDLRRHILRLGAASRKCLHQLCKILKCDLAGKTDTGQAGCGQQLGKAALGLTCFNGHAIEQELVSGYTQQESAVFPNRQALLQFFPRDIELTLGAGVIESVKPHILHQDIQAVNEGAGRRIAMGTLSCGSGWNWFLLSVLIKGRAAGNCAHITQVISQKSAAETADKDCRWVHLSLGPPSENPGKAENRVFLTDRLDFTFSNGENDHQPMTATLAAIPVKKPQKQEAGLGFWMQRVLEECDHAHANFAADPVHDLRVALRRCRSMADGLMAMDPNAAWKQMKKAGKRLFSSLGDLRDAQVMQEWVEKLGAVDDPVTVRLKQFLSGREHELKLAAADALDQFDRKQWKRWCVALPRRARKIRVGGPIFKHLALERWMAGYDLHRRAMRNRSQVAFHSLRIGIKRLRYIVENFLPEQHAAWSGDLKLLQDRLGEVHDLDVFWTTAIQIRAFPDAESRKRWHATILKERSRRIEDYRSRMAGENSLWRKWRADLPSGEQIEAAALSRLKLWGSLLDPDFRHSTHVAELALQLYDGLPGHGLNEDGWKQQRAILQVAAWLHDIGRVKKQDNHHKRSFRMMRSHRPPLGWTAEALLLAAAVARYHRGALPRAGQKTLAGLSPEDRSVIVRLAGILRLADAMDSGRKGQIHRVRVEQAEGVLLILADGYSPRERLAEAIAGGRHLLETVYHRPILFKTMPRKPLHRTAHPASRKPHLVRS